MDNVSIAIYVFIVLLYIVCTRKQHAEGNPNSPQIASARSSDDDDVATLIDRMEWGVDANARTPFHWKIMMTSITCAVVVLLVFMSNGVDGEREWGFPRAIPLLQAIIVMFVILYSAHKYFDRHHELYFMRVYTQDTANRLRKKTGSGSGKEPPYPKDWVLPADADPFWYKTLAI